MSSLADRVRGIVGVRNADAPLPQVPGRAEGRKLSSLETELGGQWRGGCLVVERRWDLVTRHGRQELASVAEWLERASAEASLFSGAPARAPFLFFDLETTGLSGGAGTLAFLVGCGWLEADWFVTRQFVLTSFADERPLLEAVSDELGRAGALVTFNGKSFDAPLIEGRYLFHRLEWIGRRLPHIDVLHPARQFWKPGTSCSLVSLERQMLGHLRVGDLPSLEIPGRYFHFVRTADAASLVAVLEHNRLDLLTLAALTASLLRLAHSGPRAARDAREALALGRVYARAGLASRACEAFQHAVDTGTASDTLVEALRWLALAWRRNRRFDEAADCWRRLLETSGCPDRVVCEAREALAIHHEHRVRDLPAALRFALQNVEKADSGKASWSEAAHHRLSRIERKMGARPGATMGRTIGATMGLLFSEGLAGPPSSPWPPGPPACGSARSARRTSS